MDKTRRTFLKTAGLAGAAATALPSLTAPAQAQGAAPSPAAGGRRSGAQELPKGMTFCTLRGADGFTLGLRTERGVLDVARAEAELKEGAPTTITDVFDGEGDIGALKRLVEKARAGAADRFFVAESAAQFGPCVTDPEKIVCIGLNYRRHAAETNNPVPTVPILFNKFNSALNSHNGTIKVSKEPAEKFDYEAELVIVIGRTARNVSEADAPLLRLRLLHRQRPYGARPPEPHEPVDDRQVRRRLGPDRPLARHRRPGRSEQPQDRAHRQRREAPVLEHLGPVIRLPEARQPTSRNT
jgi:hypothetical protein